MHAKSDRKDLVLQLYAWPLFNAVMILNAFCLLFSLFKGIKYILHGKLEDMHMAFITFM